MNNDKLTGLPEGVYIDKEAIAKETERIVNVVLGEIVDNVRDQTRLIADVDAEYIRQNVPFFIREQAAQRLGDILLDVTVLPIVDRLQDILKDAPRE